MEISERLAELRQKMAENKIDVYFIPTNDFHNSEYSCDYFKCREYMSGFDGSAGNLVVTQEEAGLWTDGRYYLQAEAQLRGSGITLYKDGMEGVIKLNDFIADRLPQRGCLGLDGRLVSRAWAAGMKRFLTPKQAELDMDKDLVGDIWAGRPPIVHNHAWLLSENYTGESRSEKLTRMRKYLAEQRADAILLTCLDDIAWLLNIRGNDIPCNPVVLSYLIVEKERCILFAGDKIFTPEDTAALEQDGIEFLPYSGILNYVRNYPQERQVIVDNYTVNARIAASFNDKVKIVHKLNPVTAWKAVKNPTEIKNMEEAHRKDGIAVTRFIYWLKHNITKLPLTEIRVAEKLEEFRKQGKDYLGPSFEPIAGYGPHGAIVHYSATEETDARLFPENFLLLDTGGQYLEGTTDITRTVLLGGEATPEQKKYYTAVLRGNLNLCAAKFLHGCSGVALDYAARQPLWEIGCDYRHGTGHGVGYLLNVHESPNGFHYRILKGPGKNAVFEEGMITSDEPGIYLEGKYGIRLENLILCVKREKNEFGQFMGFEPLTFVPFERNAIDVGQMSEKERELLNTYHQRVFEKLGDFLPVEEREWLKDMCTPL